MTLSAETCADDKAARPQGMGALPGLSGVSFRLWAPHADAVSVIGDFNEWDPVSHPLEHEDNGYWFVHVPGAQVGDGYKFRLSTAAGSFDRIDPYAAQVTSSVGHGVVYDHSAFDWQDDRFETPPHNALVIYEMHVGSFTAPDDEPVGSLESARDRFSHLKKLGVNAVELMPVAEFAGDLSWGYNPSHIFAVESAYGGPDALKRFVREAHRHGIAVILDVVYNHFGPSDLDLWQFDGWSENHKGGIYFYNDHRSSTPWGDTRPDYGREEVRRFIHDNAMMWLREYHLDGLRFDMTPYVHSVDAGSRDIPEGWDLLRWICLSVREEFPGRIVIAEDMHEDPAISSTAADGAAFHAQWDSAFVHPVRAAISGPDDAQRSVTSLAEAVQRTYNGDAFQRVVYTESHDEVANGKARVVTEIDASDPTGWYAQKRSTLGAALVMTSPGIPMLFQGQEFLQGEWFRDDVPLDWDLDREHRGIVRLYRDLVRLRLNRDGTSRGLAGHGTEVLAVDEDSNLLVFHRWAQGGPLDSVVVLVNLGAATLYDRPVRLPSHGVWRVLLNTDSRFYSELFEGGEVHDVETGADGSEGAVGVVTVPAYTVVVLGLA